jgi:DDE superfamily endonuclease/Tc5 transposase DNA-binding domain
MVKRHRSAQAPEMEKALYEWVLLYQDRVPISDEILLEKARFIHHYLTPDIPIKFSSGWLEKFKARHGIKRHIRHGESSSVDKEAIWLALPQLHDLLREYDLRDIYNFDETGLFFRLEPDMTLATKRLFGRKKDKERLTIGLCANADGSHKLPPLIIGKSQKPRCFKGIHLSNMRMKYYWNKKAWMQVSIFIRLICFLVIRVSIIISPFSSFLKDFDSRMSGRRVLLLIDNAPTHKFDETELVNTTVKFLPPNTTSALQPMDAGIIASFKRHYRQRQIK